MWLWIGILSAAAARLVLGADPARAGRIAFLFAVAGVVSFVLWPVHITYWSEGGLSYDAATGTTRQWSSEGLRPIWFPFLGLLFTRIMLLSLVPLAVTAAGWLLSEFVPLSRRAPLALAALVLFLWFPIGASGPSWWSVPAFVALVVGALRPGPRASSIPSSS